MTTGRINQVSIVFPIDAVLLTGLCRTERRLTGTETGREASQVSSVAGCLPNCPGLCNRIGCEAIFVHSRGLRDLHGREMDLLRVFSFNQADARHSKFQLLNFL
jgi:hypothetical protein